MKWALRQTLRSFSSVTDWGCFRALADNGPMTSDQLATTAGARGSAMCAEWLAAQAASRMCAAICDAQERKFSLARAGRRSSWTRTARSTWPAGFQSAGCGVCGRTEIRAGLPSPARHRLGRSLHLPVLRHGAVLQARIQSAHPRIRVATCAGRFADLRPRNGARSRRRRGLRASAASTILLAEAFEVELPWPGLSWGVHRGSRARSSRGVSHNVTFDVARAQDFGGDDYDLVTIFDALRTISAIRSVAAAHVRSKPLRTAC